MLYPEKLKKRLISFDKFYKKWSVFIEEDSKFLNLFILDNFVVEVWEIPFEKNKFTKFRFLIGYFTLLSDEVLSRDITNLNGTDLRVDINFFIFLGTKHTKTKYTITNHNFYTLISASIGMVLKYYGNYKKFFKRSYRANMLLVKFIQNTIIKFIRKGRYAFVVDGFSAKLFSYINMFNFVIPKSEMIYFLIKPKIIFGKGVFKKIKSLKRKIQKKNAALTYNWLLKLKRYHKSYYTI